MRVAVLGCGVVGSAVAKDLADHLSAELFVMDINEERAETLAREINSGWMRVNASNYRQLVNTLNGFDLVIGALPGRLGFNALKAAVEAGVDIVDVSYMPENPLTLHEDAERAGIIIIPDCGVAPGLTNILAGYGASRLDAVNYIHIMVGGIPEKPIPPLGYTITWSAIDLLEEYTRPARIVLNGEVVEVPALSGLETVKFPGLGILEAFYTDGLRTLIHTMPNVAEMWEKTLRYPGHAEKNTLT